MKLTLKLFSLVLAALPAAAYAYTFDNDVPAVIRTQITTDLAFMAQMQGSRASALHAEIFAPTLSGSAYKEFFESRVTGVGMNDCGSPKAVACVIPFMDSSKIWLTQNYVRFSHPQVAKMMIVYHEARHTETQNDNWMHATCPTPFLDENGHDMRSIWTGASLAGEDACDDTAYGSYASSMIMLKNIQKFCENCTEKVRQDAGVYADDQFKRVTSEEAKTAIRNDLYSSATSTNRR